MEWWDGFWLLVLGGIIGVVVTRLSGGLEQYVRGLFRRRKASAFEARRKSGLASSRVIAFYRESGRAGDLYCPAGIGSGGYVPALLGPGSTHRTPVLSDEAIVTIVDPDVQKKFRIDMRLIEKSREQGVTIFDGEVLYLRGLKVDDQGAPHFEVGRCNYFSYASGLLRIKQELTRQRGPGELWKKHMSSAEAMLMCREFPIAVGCATATVFTGPDGYYLPIQQRSGEVIGLSHMRVAAPTFGLESNRIGSTTSRYGVLAYNFIREFGEELFDLEGIVQAVASRRAHPDWLLALPEMQAVDAEIAAGRLDIQATGYCLVPDDAVLSIGLLAVFSSSEFMTRVQAACIGNWEAVPGGGSGPPIDFVRLDDSQIDEWLDTGQLSAGSAFCIERARAVLL